MPRPDLSRRQFLVHSASIAGASLGLSASRPARGGPADSQVRLGFIGLGDRGRRLLGAALGCESARVVGLCDVDPRKLKRAIDVVADKQEQRPRGFTNWRAVLDDSDIDAVVIATPVFLHATQTITALAAGCHVYCEKPLGLDPDECRTILAACRNAESRGLIFQTGLQRRYNPRYRESVRFLHRGEAGPVLFLRAQWHAVGASRKAKPWLHQRDRCGDIVLEQATHQFDVFNWVFDDVPERALAAGGANHPGERPPRHDTMDHYGAVLVYPGGGKVHFSHLTYAVPDRRFSGIYELAFCEKTGVDLANARAWEPDGRTRELCDARGNETDLAMASFVDALIEGRRPEAGIDQAYRATMAALLCRQAVDRGGTAEWRELDA